jgi:hypothetical protein
MVRLCMRDLVPCLLRLLELNAKKEAEKVDTEKSGKVKLASSGSFWKKLKIPIKSYLEDLLAVF